jgi:dTDP-glucose 4,6-dehydratase
MRVLVTGAAGFLGSHLCDRLLADGHRVVGADNFLTGSARNLAHLAGEPRFEFAEVDVSALEAPARLAALGALDAVLHFASPASPVDYYEHPIATLDVGSLATRHLLELAGAQAHRPGGARFLMASTSEVYGDPLVHPQPETYWGHVNSVGPRSCYDEAKRFSEALTMAYHRARGVDTRIVRIFNTYGPRMRPDDGRVVSNFCVQALRGAPLTVYGEGRQTRSFTYVSDLVDGIARLLYRARTAERPTADSALPTNVGSDREFTVAELAALVLELTGSASTIERRPLPGDDPKQRQPDLTRARATLGWSPTTPLREGLGPTIAHFRERLAEDAAAGARTLDDASVPAGAA